MQRAVQRGAYTLGQESLLGAHDVRVRRRVAALERVRLILGDEVTLRPAPRELVAQRLQRLVHRHAVIDAQGFGDLVDCPAAAHDEPFDQDRGRPLTPRVRRRAPLAPLAVAIVEEQPLDDDRDIGRQAAAPLEAAQHLVVAVDEMQANFRAEVVRFGGAQTMAPAHLARDVVDDGQTGEKEGFAFHKTIRRGRRTAGIAWSRERRPSPAALSVCARIIHDPWPGGNAASLDGHAQKLPAPAHTAGGEDGPPEMATSSSALATSRAEAKRSFRDLARHRLTSARRDEGTRGGSSSGA